MKVMVIDTALSLCTAGLFQVVDGVASPRGLRSEPLAKGHSERLGGFARDAAREAGGLVDVARIGVTVGPGSFTGLRVGLAFAQGLGAALGVPVVGVSTLDALAASASEHPGLTAALIDARRGQVYARFWDGAEARDEARALSIPEADAIVQAAADGALLIGSGAALISARPGDRTLPMEGPAPEALARLTALADPVRSPPRPLYLRAPDATPPTRLPGQARAMASA